MDAYRKQLVARGFLPLAILGMGVVVAALIVFARRRRRLRRRNDKDRSLDRFILHSEELLRERRIFVINQPLRLESEVHEQMTEQRER